jgi:hypothetical protein
MKKLMMIASLLLATTTSFARPPSPPGPGEGNYDCSRCQFQGKFGPYPAGYICINMEVGDGAGCQGGPNGCTYTGGCVSLPDDIGLHGLSP